MCQESQWFVFAVKRRGYWLRSFYLLGGNIFFSTNEFAGVISIETQQETLEIPSSIPLNKYCVSDIVNLSVL